MPSQTQLRELIQRGREERVLEYKESSPWTNLKNKIIRTAMGMANCRDEGTIIIGVSQRTGSFVQDGINATDLDTYDSDEIQEAINRHADPYVRIEFDPIEVEGKNFIALTVHEFDEVPAVCKKNGTDLREGAIYTRSYKKPETCEVRSQTEMREILELAVDKGVRGFVRRLHASGARFGDAEESDVQRYTRQLGGL